jgi:small subunit ribosomal protein S1
MEEEIRSAGTASSGEEAQASQGMQDLLDAHGHEYRGLRRGEVVSGTVVRVDRDEILVDVGSKSEGVIPASEMRDGHGNPIETLHVGDEILAYVLQTENQEGHAVLSLNRAQAEKGWRSAQKKFEDGEIIEAEIVDYNKGGLIANVEGVRGFVPLSQIVDLRSMAGSEESVEERLNAMKGRRMFLKVIEINRRRNRLILSERSAVQERRAVQKDRLLSELKEGEVRHGRVSSLCDFGAFIDLGGADGLVHLSELSWGQIGHPSQLLKVGQPVDVAVVGVDRDSKKIALSLKRLQPEPWQGVEARYQVGDIVRGRITKLASFGAFAQIEQGVEGLIHISELSDERIVHPKGVVKEGDEVPLKIIRIDAARHRLGLSLRQALEQGEEMGNVPSGAEDSVAVESSAAEPEEEREEEGLAHKVPSPVAEQRAESGQAEADQVSPTDEVDEDPADAAATAAEEPEVEATEEVEALDEVPEERSAKASSGK